MRTRHSVEGGGRGGHNVIGGHRKHDERRESRHVSDEGSAQAGRESQPSSARGGLQSPAGLKAADADLRRILRAITKARKKVTREAIERLALEIADTDKEA